MEPYYKDDYCTIYHGDCRDTLRELPDGSVNCCVTSPPYFGLRDYGEDDQIGLEDTPQDFINQMVAVFREVRRVLSEDGTLWLNLGDSYSGSMSTKDSVINEESISARAGHTRCGTSKPIGIVDGLKRKDLIGIPWRVALALQADGWYLRQDIIWHKPNPMPESVTDRCTKSHEYIFLLSKSAKYHFDSSAIAEKAAPDTAIRDRDTTRLNNTPGRSRMGGLVHNSYETRNKRSVWTVNTKPYKGAHFAVFPSELIDPCIKAGCPKGGVVLDPFGGSGTTAYVARENGCKSILCELNEDYIKLQRERLSQEVLNL